MNLCHSVNWKMTEIYWRITEWQSCATRSCNKAFQLAFSSLNCWASSCETYILYDRMSHLLHISSMQKSRTISREQFLRVLKFYGNFSVIQGQKNLTTCLLYSFIITLYCMKENYSVKNRFTWPFITYFSLHRRLWLHGPLRSVRRSTLCGRFLPLPIRQCSPRSRKIDILIKETNLLNQDFSFVSLRELWWRWGGRVINNHKNLPWYFIHYLLCYKCYLI